MQILKLIGAAIILGDVVAARAWFIGHRKPNEHNTFAPEDDKSLKHPEAVIGRSTPLFRREPLPRIEIVENHGPHELTREKNPKQVDYITNYGHYKMHQISKAYPDGKIPKKEIYDATMDIAKTMLQYFTFIPAGGILKPTETPSGSVEVAQKRQENGHFRGRKRSSPTYEPNTRVDYEYRPEQHEEHSYEPKDHGEYEYRPETVYEPKGRGQYEHYSEQHEEQRYEPKDQGEHEYHPEPVYEPKNRGQYERYSEQHEYEPQSQGEYEHQYEYHPEQSGYDSQNHGYEHHPEHTHESKDYGDHSYDSKYHGDYSSDHHDDGTYQVWQQGTDFNVTQGGFSKSVLPPGGGFPGGGFPGGGFPGGGFPGGPGGFPYEIVYKLFSGSLGNEIAHEISIKVMDITIKTQPKDSTTTVLGAVAATQTATDTATTTTTTDATLQTDDFATL